jgi:hypothetical protein
MIRGKFLRKQEKGLQHEIMDEVKGRKDLDTQEE